MCYPLKEIGTCPKEQTGTKVTFLPDDEIFTETTVYDFDVLKRRLREMSFLTKGLRIILRDNRQDVKEEISMDLENGQINELLKRAEEDKKEEEKEKEAEDNPENANAEPEKPEHFTISPAHYDKVSRLLAKMLPYYEQSYNTKFDIKLSFQKPSTDTIAVQLDNTPARNEEGELIFRPAGHGALIENLQETNADIIYIKNIDNVETDRLKQGDMQYKKMLGGMLVKLKREIDCVLQLLQSDKHNTETTARAEELCNSKLHLHLQNRNDFADNEEETEEVTGMTVPPGTTEIKQDSDGNITDLVL